MNEVIDLEIWQNENISESSEELFNLSDETETESEDEMELLGDVFYESDEDEAHQTNKYYIGLPGYIKKSGNYILLSTISSKRFLKHPFKDIVSYLHSMSICYIVNPQIHIMKLYISDCGVYNVVLKTHYIRLVQRTWKKIYKEKLLHIQKMKSLNALRMREIGNNYYSKQIPTLHGMLNI
tara:strand:+ start:254 stop:796 length:543 start_codon:yes stop_codon:yes gene_type:complete